MSIASELQNYNDGLLDAYTAVNTKGGTVPEAKNLDNLDTAIASIPAGGGGGTTRPTTWTEFAALSLSEATSIYRIGDRVEISCQTSWGEPYWQIADFGTTHKENDNNTYPCVTLFAGVCLTGAFPFDSAETPLEATEATAEPGIYYFGYDGSSYTSLGLSTGDTIPYASYTAVYKTDVTDSVNTYNSIRANGWSNWKYSNIRQWLNSDAGAEQWWTASHVGDAVASNFQRESGFLNQIDFNFRNILQKTQVTTKGDITMGDSFYDTYDYIFLPSYWEVGGEGANAPEEGTKSAIYLYNSSINKGLLAHSNASSNLSIWWLRTSSTANQVRTITAASAVATRSVAQPTFAVIACKIILTGGM